MNHRKCRNTSAISEILSSTHLTSTTMKVPKSIFFFILILRLNFSKSSWPCQSNKFTELLWCDRNYLSFANHFIQLDTIDHLGIQGQRSKAILPLMCIFKHYCSCQHSLHSVCSSLQVICHLEGFCPEMYTMSFLNLELKVAKYKWNKCVWLWKVVSAVKYSQVLCSITSQDEEQSNREDNLGP